MADRNDLEILGLLERIGTFEQLLEVYEHSVVEQSERLYAEQERLRCQGEASLDGVLSVGKSGEVLFANRRLAEIWRVAPLTQESGHADQVFRALAARTADPARFLSRVAELERGDEGREEIALRDGRTFDQYTAPIRSQSGTDFGRVWHFRDVTDFKEVGSSPTASRGAPAPTASMTLRARCVSRRRRASACFSSPRTPRPGGSSATL